MASDWIADIPHYPSDNNGGSMLGGPPRFIWHSYEAPYELTVEQACQSLIRAGHEVHFVLHPHGGLAQILPASVAGRGLKNPAGGVQTNRKGDVCIQVEVIAFAKRPFTLDLNASGTVDLRRMVAFATAHEVPRTFPSGPPPAYPSGSDERSVTIWNTKAGHYSHSQVPENDHGDPGAVNTAILLSQSQEPVSKQEDIMLIQVSDGRVFDCSRGKKWLIGDSDDPVFAGLLKEYKEKVGPVPVVSAALASLWGADDEAATKLLQQEADRYVVATNRYNDLGNRLNTILAAVKAGSAPQVDVNALAAVLAPALAEKLGQDNVVAGLRTFLTELAASLPQGE